MCVPARPRHRARRARRPAPFASVTPPPPAAIPAGALNTIVAAGVFLVLLALAGCVGVKLNNKQVGRYLLGFYAFMMVLVMIMEFAAAMTIFVFMGKLEGVNPKATGVRRAPLRAALRESRSRRHPRPPPPSTLQAVNDAMFTLVNMTFAECCCAFHHCPYTVGNVTLTGQYGACWLSPDAPYPCDTLTNFKTYLVDYIEAGVQPVAGIALFLCLLQLFTAVTACCNQCSGVKQAEKDKIAGPMQYDGLYATEGTDDAAGPSPYDAYSGYVKSGATARPGSAAPLGASAPKLGAAPGPKGGPPRPTATK